MQRPRGMRLPRFLHRTELSVLVLRLDNWYESLRSGKSQVILGSLQTLSDPATLQLIPGHLRCLPVFLFINQP